MEDIPGFSALTTANLKGDFSFSGEFFITPNTGGGKLKTFPKGKFILNAEAVQLKKMKVLGTALPLTRLNSIEVAIKTGKQIKLEKVNIRGDVQGGVTGFIRLLDYPSFSVPRSSSKCRFHLTGSVEEPWRAADTYDRIFKKRTSGSNPGSTVSRPAFRLKGRAS